MIYEKSTIYKFKESQVAPLLHKEVSKKQLLIVIKQDMQLEPEIMEMLLKMTAALKLDKSEVEYLTFSESIMLSDLMSQYEASNVLCFGAEAKDLGVFLDLKMYKLHHLDNYALLMVNQIIDIYSNQALKGKLWNELKTIAK